MSAKEMFEKLGYDYYESMDESQWEWYVNTSKKSEIVFDLKNITFYKCRLNIGLTDSINLAELQAINKQCEELGWNIKEGKSK